MDESYKISLGVDVDVSDIQSQISTKTKDTTVPIKIEIENLKDIKTQIQNLNKGNKPSLDINTVSLEKSLDRVANAIDKIKKSLNTVDGKSGMQSLLSSINQITTALGKAENETDSLVKSLSALAKKDFSLSFNLKAGNSNPVKAMTDYGQAVSRKAIPVLKEQINYLKNVIGKTTDADKALERYLVKQNKGFDGIRVKSGLEKQMSSGYDLEGNKISKSDKMLAHEEYLGYLKEVAALNNIDLSGFNAKFSKSASEIVDDTTKIQTGVKETEEQVERLKSVFGGINASELFATLDPILQDLKAIREAIDNLSKGTSIDGLTASFNRLSDVLDKLDANFDKIKNSLSNELAKSVSSNNAVKTAQHTGQQIGEAISKSAKQSLNLDDVVDKEVLALMKEYTIAGGKSSNAFDKIKQSLVDFRNGSGDINKVTSAISNNMKVVNDAKNDYKDLAEHIKMVNASGVKIHLPDSIRQEYGDDFRNMQRQLGSGRLGNAFTLGQGMDFESFVEETNSILGQTIDLSNGAEAAFGDLVRKINSTKAPKFLTGDDLFKNGILDMGDVVANVSTSLEKIENAEEEIARTSTSVANTVSSNISNIVSGFKNADIVIGATEDNVDNLKNALGSLGFNDSSIDTLTKDFEQLGISVKNVTTRLREDGSITLTVKGIDQYERAVTTMKSVSWNDDAEEWGIKNLGTTVSQSLKESERFIKQQKKAVADLTSDINELNRKTIDQNEPKPIKDSSHLDSLKVQYDTITKAIEKMGRASNDNDFQEERNNVNALISEYRSLAREYKNAETVATSLRSKDIDTVKSTYDSKLDVLISKMRKDGVYTSGFEKGAENLRSVLSSSTDASGLVRFLNGLDKLDAGYKRASASAKEFNQAQKVGINVSGLESKIADLQRISPEIDKFETEIDGAKVSVQRLLKDLGQVKTQGDFSVVNSKFKAFTDSAKAAGIAVTEVTRKMKSVDDIELDMELGTYDNQMSSMYDKLDRLSGASKELREGIEQVENAYRDMNNALKGTGDEVVDRERLVQAEKDYAAALEKTNNLIKIQSRAEAKDARNQRLIDDREVFQAKIDAWLTKNSAATKKFGAQLLDLRAKAETADRVELNHLEKELQKVDKAADKAGLKMMSVTDKIKSKAKEYMAYFSVAEIFMEVTQAMKRMFDTVVEIDTAMTGLYRVTDLTSAQYDILFDNMISSAKEYGATLNDIINATTDWVRAGFDADTALGLAEVTTMYQHISDLDYDTAAENLITAYNGFKDELNGAFDGDTVSAVNYIADIFNELDKQNCP